MPAISRQSPTLGYVLILAVLAANAVLMFVNLRTIVASERWTQHTLEVQNTLEQWLATLTEVESDQRSYLLSGDRSLLKPSEQTAGQLDRLQDQLEALTADNPDQQARLALLRPLTAQRLASLAHTLSVREQFGLEATVKQLQTRRGKQLMDQIHRVVAEMVAEEERLRERRARQTNQAIRRTVYAFTLVNGTALALLAGLVLRQRSQEREQRQAVEALARSEQRLQITLASLAEGVITTDRHGQILFLNPSAERLTGWSSAEVRGQPLSQVLRLLDEQHRQPAADPVARVLDSRQVVHGKPPVLLQARDQRERPVESSAAPIQAADGEFDGVVLVLRDVSERRRQEQQVRQSREQLQRILDNAVDFAILTIDLAGDITSWNTGAERIFGYSTAEILGTPAHNLYRPEERAQGLPERENQRALEAGRAVQDGWLLRKDGQSFWASGILSPMREGQRLVGWLRILRDTTAQQQTEQELERSRTRLDLVVNSSELGLWSCDLPSHEMVWNTKCKEHFGLPPGADINLDAFFQQIHPRDRKRVRKQIGVALARRGVYDLEFRTLGPVEQQRWIRATGRAFCDARGKPQRFDGVTIDITSRVRQEEALREADRQKDEFLATLAHELRNPLAPIRNALHLMARSGERNHEFEQERAMAERQVEHLARLVDDLMDVARISTGKIELHTLRIDLSQVVQRALEAAQPLIAERGHRLTVTGIDQPIWLEGDPTRLEQVLWNLLNNAAKYTEPGGQITIEVQRHARRAEIRVRDNGMGITPELLPRIFNMFVQADTCHARSQGGLGIGLGLASKLVELHGGTITAQSQGPGQGAEFTVTLPAAVAPPPLPERSLRVHHAHANLPLPRHRVLVVDDNRDAAVSLGRLLERLYGQEVRVAHDGPSALATAEQFHPDVILLDIGMPGMDGHEVARRLRQRPDFAHTLLVAITGWGQEADRQRSSQAGFQRHLVKPVDPAEIRALLAESPVEPT